MRVFPERVLTEEARPVLNMGDTVPRAEIPN